ncbi:MAG: methyltransferase domain-containing protein [Minisyncoccales bacterium]
MNFENNYIEENKELSQYFLKEQIFLPKEEWSEDFMNYVDKKFDQENRDCPTRSPEEEQDFIFNRYLKGFDIKEDDIKDKNIFDLGCGDGEFVKECLEKGVSDGVYGLDYEIEDIDERYQNHIFQGDFTKKLPKDNLDIILSYGAIGSYSHDYIKLKQILLGSLDSLNEKGEIRICPVQLVPPNSELVGFKEDRENLEKVLADIKQKFNIFYEFKPIDIRAAGKDKDVWLEEVLIIKKNPISR